jgi:hypothetical protein
MQFLTAVFALVVLSGGVPDTIEEGSEPVWVAEHVAVDTHGQLRISALGQFREFIVRQEQTARKHGREKCGVWFGAMVDSIDPVVETVSGRVVAIRQGFYTGLPGSLMRLETMDAKERPRERRTCSTRSRVSKRLKH